MNRDSKITIHMVSSLDGKIAKPDNSIEWFETTDNYEKGVSEPELKAEGKFKAANRNYNDVKEINKKDLKRWLKKAIEIQWDYKNIVKRKGVMERLDMN